MNIKKILVIGASGFVGRHLAQGLLAEGYIVRCLARNPAKVQDLATAGCEIAQGDISDLSSMQSALESVNAVYISVHTISPQNASTVAQNFMDIEMHGLQNIVTACQTQGVRRLVYIAFLGVSPDAPSAWIRGRWEAEQFLLNTRLDITVIRPGMIVGVGGQGFNMMLSNARRRISTVMGSGQQKFRSIAIDDLVYYLVGVLNDSRSYEQRYDVGSDDVLTNDQMIDVVAEVLGQRHPAKFHIPQMLLIALSPLIERMSKLPRGSMKGILDSMKTDLVGDPMPIRRILPRPPLSNRQSVEQTLARHPCNN